jgi:tryptophan 2,3-dioxygenase
MNNFLHFPDLFVLFGLAFGCGLILAIYGALARPQRHQRPAPRRSAQAGPVAAACEREEVGAMSDKQLWRALEQFAIGDYLHSARSQGRLGVASALRTQAVALFEQAVSCGPSDAHRSAELRQVLELIKRALAPEAHLAKHGWANYPAYIGAPVLTWMLGTDQHTTHQTVWANCWTAMRALVDDVWALEVRSLAGTEPYHRENCHPEVVAPRAEQLHALLQRLDCLAGPPAPVPELPQDWRAYALAPQRTAALVDLTGLPLTRQHDEYFFMRAVQISECGFWGALTGVLAALKHVEHGAVSAAAEQLATATEFMDVLLQMFQVVKRTLPAAHFMGFREATDGSSAIQSRPYHLLEIATRGIAADKAAVLVKIPEIVDLFGDDYRGPGSLKDLLQSDQAALADDTFRSRVAALDRALYAWRRLHLGKVRSTLPADIVGTGGTGVSYLEAHVQPRIIAR